MTEAQIREIVQQAIQAERARIVTIFRSASAEFTNSFGEVRFDFEASISRIADAIESEELP